ncbi:MAG: CAAX prenyl protease-related protein [Chthoniobacterales bacterium]
MHSNRRALLAHVLPMGCFIALLAIGQWLPDLGQSFLLRHAEFWIYPLQTIACGALLFYFRRSYELTSPRFVAVALLVGAIVFFIWVAPQQFLGFTPRTIGFDPTLLRDSHLYSVTVLLRFIRLVVIVPFVEEIFWRAFLLRFLIDENFERVPFGTFSWTSFAIVTLAFAFSHTRADWPAALLTGGIYNVVAYRTRRLTSCIIAHATTNCLLGLWIMQTRQWGFW